MKVLSFIVSLFLSVLSGMGVGGGGLLVIYLTLALGTDQLHAQAANLIFFISASVSALSVNLRRRKLDLKRIAALAVPGSAASVLGAFLACKTDTATVRIIFGVLLLLSGTVAFFRKSER